jgi:uracil-DNA glycosylase family 4
MTDDTSETVQEEVRRMLEEAQPGIPDNGKPVECRLCPLYDADGIVPGEGPTEDVDILLLGEAPGETEVFIKRPFVGGSGRILNRLLAGARIQRSKTYVTNVVKCRPTVVTHEGKVKDRPPTNTEIENCARFLVAELDLVKPKLIVALGGTALFVLKNTNKIGKHRGVPFETSFGKAIATYHPAGLMRQQSLFPLVIRDLALAAQESKTRELVRIEIGINSSARAGTDGATLLQRARDAGFCTFDLETTGFDPADCQIICISTGVEALKSEVYAWNSDTARVIRSIWDDPSIEKVGQNCEDFDWYFLHGKNFPEAPAGNSFDTLLAFHLIKSDLKKDLGTLGSVYTDMEYWKDEGKGGWKRTEEHVTGSNLFNYCGKDNIGTTRSYLSQREQLKKLDLWDLYYKNVMPLQPILRRMRIRGVKKDVEKAALWADTMRVVADEKEQLLKNHLGQQDFNMDSSVQVIRLLYDTLKLPPQYIADAKKGSRLTGNDEAITNLARITDDPTFLLFNEIRSLRKWASTYCEAEADDNGFMHTHFGCAKAANGRLNSWDPGLQNWPEDMREIVIPDTPDHILIACDWSQIEWRISMVRAADKAGLEMMTSGVDNHSITAAECFQVALDIVAEEKINPEMTYRHAAKFIVYGLGYGRQATSIAKQLGRPKEWVEGFIGRYFGKFSSYSQYRMWEEGFVRENNFLRNPFKRRRWWYSMNLPELYNFYPSSTAADMMYLVIPQVERQLPAGATLRLTVHDELVVCSTRDSKTVKQAAECLTENMSRVWPEITDDSVDSASVKRFYPSGWSCPSDLSLGNTWKDCKDKSFQKTQGKALKKEYGL